MTAGTAERHREALPREDTGNEVRGEPARDDRGHPLQLGDLREVDVVGEETELEPARERDELGVDLVDLGHLVVDDEHA